MHNALTAGAFSPAYRLLPCELDCDRAGALVLPPPEGRPVVLGQPPVPLAVPDWLPVFPPEVFPFELFPAPCAMLILQ